MTIAAAQLDAARQLLGWSQDHVATASGLETPTIVHFELGKQSPSRAALADIRMTLEAAGVDFTNGGEPGMRLRKAKCSLSRAVLNSRDLPPPHQSNGDKARPSTTRC
jgi:transcriptional regulator with XRE-family HTH domain